MNIASRVSTLTAALLIGAAASPAAGFASPSAPSGFSITTFASAPQTTPATTGPDDIARLGGDVFVGWQNGVGPKGEPNPTTGQTSGVVVEYSSSGQQLASWALTGKIDGLGSDPSGHRVVATVNEDGNSSLYTITPGASPGDQVRHYTYSPAPDSAATGGLLTGGGTDAVVVFRGHIYVSASAPGTPGATAVFQADLNPATGVATLKATFEDSSAATDGVNGERVKLHLTDPDSNAAVPPSSTRFGGQFVLGAQGDQQLVFARRLSSTPFDLTRLLLWHGADRAGGDDVRWSEGRHGRLLVVDNKARVIYAISGDFAAGMAFASLDTVGANAKTTEVDTIDLKSGQLTPFITGLGTAKGLLWLPG